MKIEQDRSFELENLDYMMDNIEKVFEPTRNTIDYIFYSQLQEKNPIDKRREKWKK